ncbi:formate dehydrogenase accessory sulfurtransferase FdhD [Desulfonauticus submarinus]
MLVKCKASKFFKDRKVDFFDTIAAEERVDIFFKSTAHSLWTIPYNLSSLVLGYAKLELLPDGGNPVIIKREENRFWIENCISDNYKKIKGKKYDFKIDVLKLLEINGLFIKKVSSNWEQTGCFHRVAFWSIRKGDFVIEVEDVGRHNCLDRMVGLALKNEIDLQEGILLVSARLTRTFLEKVVKAGVRFVMSRSAVTSAALTLAEREKMTLVGFARENRLSVFSDILERVVCANA